MSSMYSACYHRIMPSRNVVKLYDTDAYYHVYNRGVEKRTIFLDSSDYAVFVHLLRRYLSQEPELDRFGRKYGKLYDDVSLVAFCLMPNHFHMLIYQHDVEGVTRLMRAVAGSYTRYFNRKYERVGTLFQGVFKASRITDDAYFEHITRYIHLNPEDYLGWDWSSLSFYLGYREVDWIHPGTAADTDGSEKYLHFLEDYRSYQSTLDEVHSLLADH